MTIPRPDFNREEFARLGDAIFETNIHPGVGAKDDGKFALIDIDSGDFEIDLDEIAASDRLLARRPGARVWLVRIGSRHARRFGAASGRRAA